MAAHLPHWTLYTPEKLTKIEERVGIRDGLVIVLENNSCPRLESNPDFSMLSPYPNHNIELPKIKLKAKNAGMFVINNGAQITATGQTEIKTKRGPQVYVL